MYVHCGWTYCLYFEFDRLQDYAKSQAEKHRRKIILPCVIPWEYGSNKYASQKGSGGFGTIRSGATKVVSSKKLSESNDGVVPWLNCPPLRDPDLGSQSGLTSFGSQRVQVMRAREKGTNEVKEVSRIVNDPLSESILTMWSRPNPEAKSGQIFGGHRNVIPKMTGGRELSEKEQNECRAAIPRFQDPRHTLAAIANGRPGDNIITGLHNNRKTITPVEGLETPDGQHELEPHRYMAWLGGQLTLQSQSRTGGFNKTRDVVSPSYYDHCMNERRHSTKELRKKFERLGKEENPENISNSETDDTDISNTDEILNGDHEETKKNDCNDETHETISDAL